MKVWLNVDIHFPENFTADYESAIKEMYKQLKDMGINFNPFYDNVGWSNQNIYGWEVAEPINKKIFNKILNNEKTQIARDGHSLYYKMGRGYKRKNVVAEISFVGDDVSRYKMDIEEVQELVDTDNLTECKIGDSVSNRKTNENGKIIGVDQELFKVETEDGDIEYWKRDETLTEGIKSFLKKPIKESFISDTKKIIDEINWKISMWKSGEIKEDENELIDFIKFKLNSLEGVKSEKKMMEREFYDDSGFLRISMFEELLEDLRDLGQTDYANQLQKEYSEDYKISQEYHQNKVNSNKNK